MIKYFYLASARFQLVQENFYQIADQDTYKTKLINCRKKHAKAEYDSSTLPNYNWRQ